ncbi:MAG: hypothetical protein IT561_13560 [Alphaproteobacteria bacterium]|nr:hypothetical protein [Alphaproteobacteria bacterium]
MTTRAPETTKAVARRPGRPTLHSDAVAAMICERIAAGASLRTVCLAADMPGLRTVYDWLRQRSAFREAYATACIERAAALAEEALEIADTAARAATPEAVQVARLRVDTRKWMAAKLDPKRFSERVQADVDVSLSFAEIVAHAAVLRRQGEADA